LPASSGLAGALRAVAGARPSLVVLGRRTEDGGPRGGLAALLLHRGIGAC
jgi:hypothetical protein